MTVLAFSEAGLVPFRHDTDNNDNGVASTFTHRRGLLFSFNLNLQLELASHLLGFGIFVLFVSKQNIFGF